GEIMIRVRNILADVMARAAQLVRHDLDENSDDGHWFVENEDLAPSQWKSLQFLGRSSRDFEPLSANLDFLVASWLLEKRLAERGRIDVTGQDYPMGYRITARGRAVLERGRLAPNRPG